MSLLKVEASSMIGLILFGRLRLLSIPSLFLPFIRELISLARYGISGRKGGDLG